MSQNYLTLLIVLTGPAFTSCVFRGRQGFVKAISSFMYFYHICLYIVLNQYLFYMGNIIVPRIFRGDIPRSRKYRSGTLHSFKVPLEFSHSNNELRRGGLAFPNLLGRTDLGGMQFSGGLAGGASLGFSGSLFLAGRGGVHGLTLPWTIFVRQRRF